MVNLTDREILERLAQGVSLDVLAADLGVTVRRASSMVIRASERVAAMTPTDVLKLQVELQHLDLIRRALTPAMLAGDVAAARVLERVARTRLAAENLMPDAKRDAPPAANTSPRSASGETLARLRAERSEPTKGSNP